MSKYHNEKITINGETFDSKLEAKRYGILKLYQKAGKITRLERQVKFEIIPKGVDPFGKFIKPETYIADFTYTDSDGRFRVEDVKGYRKGAAWNLFQAKRKALYYLKGIWVEVVTEDTVENLSWAAFVRSTR